MLHTKALSLPNIFNNQNNQKKILSRLTDKDYKKHPELYGAISNRNIYALDLITNTLPPMKASEEIFDQRKRDMINDLYSFHQLYSEYTTNESQLMSQLKKARYENKDFTNQYNKLFNHNSKLIQLKNGNMLNDIQYKYEQLNYKLPKTDIHRNNLFKETPLLLMNSDLNNYYLHNRESKQYQENSIHFLKKLEEELLLKSSNEHQKDSQIRVELRLIEEQKKNKRKLKREIRRNRREISKVKKTLKTIENDEEFFVTKNMFNYKKSNTTIIKKPLLIEPTSPTIIKRDNECPNDKVARSKRQSLNNDNGKVVLFKSNKRKSTSLMSSNMAFINNNDNSDSNSSRMNSLKNNPTKLEHLYNEVKEQKLRNVQEKVLQKCIPSDARTIFEEKTSKGFYLQFNRIKDKLLSKDCLTDNLMLKSKLNRYCEYDKNNQEDKDKEIKNTNIKACLVNSEKMLIIKAYDGIKEEDNGNHY